MTETGENSTSLEILPTEGNSNSHNSLQGRDSQPAMHQPENLIVAKNRFAPVIAPFQDFDFPDETRKPSTRNTLSRRLFTAGGLAGLSSALLVRRTTKADGGDVEPTPLSDENSEIRSNDLPYKLGWTEQIGEVWPAVSKSLFESETNFMRKVVLNSEVFPDASERLNRTIKFAYYRAWQHRDYSRLGMDFDTYLALLSDNEDLRFKTYGSKGTNPFPELITIDPRKETLITFMPFLQGSTFTTSNVETTGFRRVLITQNEEPIEDPSLNFSQVRNVHEIGIDYLAVDGNGVYDASTDKWNLAEAQLGYYLTSNLAIMVSPVIQEALKTGSFSSDIIKNVYQPLGREIGEHLANYDSNGLITECAIKGSV